MASVLQSTEEQHQILILYDVGSDSYVVTWEVKCLELQHLIISIFVSRILKYLLFIIYLFIYLLFSRANLLRTLFNIQAEEGSSSDGT